MSEKNSSPVSHGKLLEEFEQLLTEEKLKIHLPNMKGLRRHLPGGHFHLFPEVFFQIEGSTAFTFPHEKWVLRAKEVCVMPRGVPHAEVLYHGRKPFRALYICKGPERYSIHQSSRSRNREHIMHDLQLFSSECHGQMIRYLDDIANAPEKLDEEAQTVYRRTLFHAYLKLIQSEIYSAHQPQLENNRKVAVCKEIIRTELSDSSLTVKRLAENLRCSPDYLSRLFSQEEGISLISYIHQQRVTYAAELLSETQLNISEIAWACGFSHPSYFNRIFKKFYDMSPKLYRNLK